MIAVLTKWQKNAPTSIAWPNTLTFISSFSETNLPPGFTLVEYFVFKTYVENLTSSSPAINVIINSNVEDNDGNIINSRVFIDDEEFNTYKALSDASEVERNSLITMFNLTRTVKIFTDDDTIIDIIDKSATYSEIDSFFTV